MHQAWNAWVAKDEEKGKRLTFQGPGSLLPGRTATKGLPAHDDGVSLADVLTEVGTDVLEAMRAQGLVGRAGAERCRDDLSSRSVTVSV